MVYINKKIYKVLKLRITSIDTNAKWYIINVNTFYKELRPNS